MKTKNTETIRAEIADAKRKLEAANAKAAALESAGEMGSIDDLTRTLAESRLLSGSIRRMEAELPGVEIAECETEIARLMQVTKDENATAEKRAAELQAKAEKLLLPEIGSHPAWTDLTCKRRRHEIGLLVATHPHARNHTDAAAVAHNRADALRARIRELKGEA